MSDDFKGKKSARRGKSGKKNGRDFAPKFNWDEVDDEVQPEAIIPSRNKKRKSGKTTREPHLPSTLSAVNDTSSNDYYAADRFNHRNVKTDNVNHSSFSGVQEDDLTLPSYGRPLQDNEEDDFIRALLAKADEPDYEDQNKSSKTQPKKKNKKKSHNDNAVISTDVKSSEKESDKTTTSVPKGKKVVHKKIPPASKIVIESDSEGSDTAPSKTQTHDISKQTSKNDPFKMQYLRSRLRKFLRHRGDSPKKIDLVFRTKTLSTEDILWQFLEAVLDTPITGSGEQAVDREQTVVKEQAVGEKPIVAGKQAGSKKEEYDQRKKTVIPERRDNTVVESDSESDIYKSEYNDSEHNDSEVAGASRYKSNGQAKISKSIEKNTKKSGFDELNLSSIMRASLEDAGYEEPTPVQKGTIARVMAGVDLIGQAKTGTGKTAAFLIPIIEQVEKCGPGNNPVALIIVPTRELAVQVRDEAVKLLNGRDYNSVAVYGGKPIASQIQKLHEGVDIVIGTPGRIIDLVNRHALIFSELHWVVLDEADRMLDIGFRPDIEKILKQTPKSRQTLLFSATLPEPVVHLAFRYMHNPEQYDFSEKEISADTIEQYYISVDKERKFDALIRLLEKEQPRQAIVFCRTKRAVDRIGSHLKRLLPDTGMIHGDMTQEARDDIMQKFRKGRVRILVATDVIGRGIDISGISHIINYDIPQFCDDYVHRVGRTGRMGREGVAITLVSSEEGIELTRIEKRINRLLKRIELENFEAYTRPDDNEESKKQEIHKPVYGASRRIIRRAL